jgi:hypothetical protein
MNTSARISVENPRRQRVSRERFLQLLVGRNQLVRLDDTDNSLRGLVDESGRWFVIDELELSAPVPHSDAHATPKPTGN